MFQLGFSFILVLLTVGVINILFNSLCLVLAFKAFDPYLGKDELIPAFFRAIGYWVLVGLISLVAILIGGAANSGLLLLLLCTYVNCRFYVDDEIFVMGAGEA